MAEYDNNRNGNDDGQGGYEDVCFICHRPESKAGRMFKLPNNICVCDDCMHKTMDSMNQFNFQGMMPPFYDFSGMTGGAGTGQAAGQDKNRRRRAAALRSRRTGTGRSPRRTTGRNRRGITRRSFPGDFRISALSICRICRT